MSSRESILSRIRAALTDVPDGEGPDDVAVPRRYRRSHLRLGESPIDLFAERTAEYRATVVRTVPSGVPAAVAAALTHRGAHNLALPDGFPTELLPAGAWHWTPEPRDSGALELVDGVVTLAAAAIAVTGTIVLDTRPGQGRRALTLVPDYHLCIVRAEQIAHDVPDALGRLDPALPLTLISGPSATSDIELDRVEGVHGPRTLDVIIIESGPPEHP
ncbi:LUD domain-containing protein [Streptomyces sp. NPDC051582]|uniref:LutC/YkgG family protein n=1 Tax=Streptomyces sp. NPDC051582 TaxID=3155167 RepID=UPI00341FDC02